MNEDVILCQKEIQRLRCVVRTYESQMRELENYLEQMAENQMLGDEARRVAREIFRIWKWILEE
ncbi:hypothetical protein C818_00288 [Lachnospiraceae bacterium MD308]|nr:hypothetical protein C818_00288 [Lachnospiraceae bacterium MD308]